VFRVGVLPQIKGYCNM